MRADNETIVVAGIECSLPRAASGSEAVCMDFQQRMLLDVVHKAIEDGGVVLETGAAT